ncbi:MAG: DUF1987 domain-containing protein [Bacteroidales bacterium]|nr:DUF1987 domain-containing protein [Bacteroidales bacterium]
MRPLILDASHDTPRVHFDKYSNRFEIMGVSLPPNIFEFYNPLLNWINDYCKNPNEHTHLKLRFEYLNTSSTKMIMNLVTALGPAINRGSEVKVLWYYDSGDLEMKEMGEEFASNSTVPFHLVSK